MKRLLPAFVFVALAVYGVVAFAGGVKAAKKVVAPETETAIVASKAVTTTAVKPHLVRKTASVLEQVIGSTYYSYGWNSGGPRHTVWYKDGTGASRAYMIYITRAGDTWAGLRQITYVVYDGSTFSAPVAVVPPTTQATYFSGIDVWKGGAADGLAGVGAGWAGSGNSYYALESAAGAGGFTTTQVSPDRDVQATCVDNAGTVVFNTSLGRTDYAFRISTDFGTTWVDGNQSLLSYLTHGETQGALEPPIVSRNGKVWMLTDPTGTGQIPPVGTAVADSANKLVLYASTNAGLTWTHTVICPDGNQYEPRHYSLWNNFGQYDLAVDASEKPHAVLNGYSMYQFDPASQDSLRFSIDCVYWDPTHGFKSLVSFDRSDPYISATGGVIDNRDGNSLGCSYPSIAISNDGQKIVCTWSQPIWSGTTQDTTPTGNISQAIWYNASFDGGATWKGAQKLTTTTGLVEEYSSLADELEDVAGGVKARMTFIRCQFSNTGTSGVPGQVVYLEWTINATDVKDNANKPFTFTLDQNYPNPFNPSTTISYTLPTATNVKLSVYNVLGQEVATLVNDLQTAGSHSVDFNSANLASGVYFYTIKAGNFTDTKKMALMK